MNRHRFKRIAFFAGLAVFIIATCFCLWPRQQRRHETLNRQLITAMVTSDEPQAIALVNAGADPNTRYTPPPAPVLQRFWNYVLHRSPPSGKVGPSAFEMACGSRWDSSFKDARDWPIRTEAPQLVQSMILHGAHLNTMDKDGLMPLHWATVTGRPKTVRVLVENGANLNNVSTVCGLSPLELACFKCPDSVRFLLEHGANAREQTQDGRTALQWAVLAACGSESLNDRRVATEVIQQLLLRGADANLPDKKRKTAIDYAQVKGCPELVPLLQKVETKK